jgi:hypothetical protein
MQKTGIDILKNVLVIRERWYIEICCKNIEHIGDLSMKRNMFQVENCNILMTGWYYKIKGEKSWQLKR